MTDDVETGGLTPAPRGRVLRALDRAVEYGDLYRDEALALLDDYDAARRAPASVVGRGDADVEWIAARFYGDPCPTCGTQANAEIRPLAPLLAARERAAKAEGAGEALTAAADVWQWGEWTALTEPIKAPEQPQRIVGAAQAVTDWLRARAASYADQPDEGGETLAAYCERTGSEWVPAPAEGAGGGGA